MNEAVCDAFYKGFEEYKRKVMQAFHLPDLMDIVADESEEVEEGVDAVARDELVGASEAVEAEADLDPQEPNPSKPSDRQANRARCG